MVNKIWTYWHQGFEQAPFVAKHCIEQVKALHPHAEIFLLDRQSVYDFADSIPIPQSKWEKMLIQHKSDLLRTHLLIKYGGTWLDPTVFCLKSFEDWLPDKLQAGAFFFYRPGKDRIISNWFIAAEKENYILKSLYLALIEYWNSCDFRNLDNRDSMLVYWANRLINGRSLELSKIWLNPVFKSVLKIYPYMIYHFIFYDLIMKDLNFRVLFEKMPKVSANGPHLLQNYGLLSSINAKAKLLVDNKQEPLLKLKWKIEEQKIDKDSNLAYLFSKRDK